MAEKDSKLVEGIVFNVQRFTVHDGPGIRTEIFLKGCPLHCKWCSNPEGINIKQEVGVTHSRCIGIDKCGYCLDACPKASDGALVIEDNKIMAINREICTGCMECAEACPANALKVWGEKMTVQEVMKVILSDRSFYKESGGGVTFSGGEALVQWEFVLEVLKECKKQGIHTCVETALHCKTEILDQINPYVDLMITDIKHMDTEKHKEYTGLGNELTLKNIKKVVQMGINLIIRIPVIPDHNDSEENIRKTSEFIVNELNNQVKQVQLLRYRRLGEKKYESLGLEYPLGNFEVSDRDEFEKRIRHLAEIMKSYGIPAMAGTTNKIQ